MINQDLSGEPKIPTRGKFLVVIKKKSPQNWGKYSPWKFNSSPLKNDGWKMSLLLGRPIFRVYVKLPGGNPPIIVVDLSNEKYPWLFRLYRGYRTLCYRSLLYLIILGCPAGT